MNRDGIIKFSCHLIDDEPPDEQVISELNDVRSELFRMGYIGVNKDNIACGNLSIRFGTGNQFIITGTQTGGKPVLEPKDYTLVSEFNIVENSLTCRGKIKASSESLTHAAAYLASKQINAVIHIHSKQLWEKHYNSFQATPEEYAYGTPEIAFAVEKICRKKIENIIVLKGHEEGIIITGNTLQDALKLVKSL